ncbi:MAG: hypothetical protein MK212_06600 [Saprospiraceae bacterium]|nr:hypothetical protein [Saprospiraceae bacterium]
MNKPIYLAGLVLVCFSLSILSINAQSITEIQQNKDIIWAGEIFVDYEINEDQRNTYNSKKLESIQGTSSFKLIKQQLPSPNAFPHEGEIQNRLFSAESLTFTVYKNSDLKEAYPKDHLATVFNSFDGDVISIVNPKTSKEVKYQLEGLGIGSIDFFRLKQHIYYDEKRLQFITVPIAFAPLARLKIEGDEDYYPLFWIPIESRSEGLDLSDPNLTWVKRSYRSFAFEDVESFKSNKDRTKIFKEMRTKIQKRAQNIELSDVFLGEDGEDLMSPDEIVALEKEQRVDTGWNFEEVAEEDAIILDHRLDAKRIKKIDIIQDWIWDEKEGKLYINHVGFSPIMEYYNSKNKLIGELNVFMRRVDFQ